MKTMQNFAAQQLTKKQMNDVKGGQKIVTEELLLCRFYDGNGDYVGCNFVIGDMTQMMKETANNGFTMKCDTNF